MESNLANQTQSAEAVGDVEQWLHMYQQMSKIRQFEEKVNELYMSAKMPGLAHLYTGEEAVARLLAERHSYGFKTRESN